MRKESRLSQGRKWIGWLLRGRSGWACISERQRRAAMEILHGRAAETLAEYASRNGIDLIVMATHGRSGVSRWVWGGVADRILRSACVPVLMVRAPGCVPGI